MKRFCLILFLATLVTGCAEEPKKEKPVPPDDLSNGPWKYQKDKAKPAE